MRTQLLPYFLGLMTLAAGEASSASVQPPGFGFRGDRNGFFDGCRDLPQSWAENTNVVWKVRLPSWNHGDPLILKGRIYLLNEPDFGAAPEHIGPSLSCLDPVDGSILWTVHHDHWDLLSEPEKTVGGGNMARIARISVSVDPCDPLRFQPQAITR